MTQVGNSGCKCVGCGGRERSREWSKYEDDVSKLESVKHLVGKDLGSFRILSFL